MKVWLLNNTKLDKKKNWEKYFENEFIPKLKKYYKKGDIVLHLGHIFNNSDIISIRNINSILKIFRNITKISPLYLLDGYDTELLSLLKNIKNIKIINVPILIDNIKIIPKGFNVIENIEGDIIFINSQIEQDMLLKYPNKKFFCGFYDMLKFNKNIIDVGTPYQLHNKTSSGFFVINSKDNKYKYFKNEYDIRYDNIIITDIAQIEKLDKEYINKNNITIEIDKTLVDEKKIKIDILLNDFNFKKITYINDNDTVVETLNTTSLKMEDLLLEKIKNSDNELLLSEFQKILKIYKEKY